MMKKSLLASLATGLLLLGMTGVASASNTILFADTFEGDSVGLNQYTFANWTIPVGSVDLIGTGTGWNWFPAHGKYVDLDGSTNSAGTMVAKNPLLLAAGNYLLKFDLAGSQRGGSDSVTVSAGNSSQTWSLNSAALFTNYTQAFTLAGTQTVALRFAASGHDNMGLLLDNVSLEKVSPTPEPATMLLLGSGLIGLLGARRKKND